MVRKLVYRPSHSDLAEHDVREHCEESPAESSSPDSGQVSKAGAVPRAPERSAPTAQTSAGKGLFRPLKQRVTIRLDADVIEWFKQEARSKGQGRGYQTLINRALRDYMQRG